MSVASTAGTIGSVIGGPVGGLIGTGVGAIGDVIFGNNAAAASKKNADKAAQKAQKANKTQWRIDKRNNNRAYDVAVRNQQIDYRNLEADLKFQEESRQQQYDYQMGIRDYQYNQQVRAYDESVNRANKQKSFNQLAEELSIQEQLRFNRETLQGIAFTDAQTMMDFAAATAGLEVKRGQAQAQSQLALGQAGAKYQLEVGQIQGTAERQLLQAQAKSDQEIFQAEGLSQTQLRQAKGAAELSTQRVKEETSLGIKIARSRTQLARQQSRIEALKARGSALAAGQAGRSAAKISQALRAEAGAEQSGLVEQFKLAEESALQKQFFDVMSIDQQLMFTEQNVAQSLMNLRQNSLLQLLSTQQTVGQESMFAQQNSLSQFLTTQQNVVQQLMFTEQGIDLDLTNLNSQLELDKQMISASRENLSAAGKQAERKIKLARQQADLEAEANIRLKPEIAPPLPEPLTLPRPEMRKIFKPKQAAEPVKGNVFVPSNQAATIANSIGVFANVAQKSGVFDDLFSSGNSRTNFGTAGVNFPTFGSGVGLGVSDASVFDFSLNPMSPIP